jgi:hypothetical protein
MPEGMAMASAKASDASDSTIVTGSASHSTIRTTDAPDTKDCPQLPCTNRQSHSPYCTATFRSSPSWVRSAAAVSGL